MGPKAYQLCCEGLPTTVTNEPHLGWQGRGDKRLNRMCVPTSKLICVKFNHFSMAFPKWSSRNADMGSIVTHSINAPAWARVKSVTLHRDWSIVQKFIGAVPIRREVSMI